MSADPADAITKLEADYELTRLGIADGWTIESHIAAVKETVAAAPALLAVAKAALFVVQSDRSMWRGSELDKAVAALAEAVS